MAAHIKSHSDGSNIDRADLERIEWVEIIEPRTRQHMYANLTSGECVWEPPTGVRVKKTDNNQWWELFDQKTSRFYYYNASTQTTIWQRPSNSDIIPLAKLQTLKQNTEVNYDFSPKRREKGRLSTRKQASQDHRRKNKFKPETRTIETQTDPPPQRGLPTEHLSSVSQTLPHPGASYQLMEFMKTTNLERQPSIQSYNSGDSCGTYHSTDSGILDVNQLPPTCSGKCYSDHDPTYATLEESIYTSTRSVNSDPDQIYSSPSKHKIGQEYYQSQYNQTNGDARPSCVGLSRHLSSNRLHELRTEEELKHQLTLADSKLQQLDMSADPRFREISDSRLLRRDDAQNVRVELGSVSPEKRHKLKALLAQNYKSQPYDNMTAGSVSNRRIAGLQKRPPICQYPNGGHFIRQSSARSENFSPQLPHRHVNDVKALERRGSLQEASSNPFRYDKHGIDHSQKPPINSPNSARKRFPATVPNYRSPLTSSLSPQVHRKPPPLEVDIRRLAQSQSAVQMGKGSSPSMPKKSLEVAPMLYTPYSHKVRRKQFPKMSPELAKTVMHNDDPWVYQVPHHYYEELIRHPHWSRSDSSSIDSSRLSSPVDRLTPPRNIDRFHNQSELSIDHHYDVVFNPDRSINHNSQHVLAFGRLDSDAMSTDSSDNSPPPYDDHSSCYSTTDESDDDAGRLGGISSDVCDGARLEKSQSLQGNLSRPMSMLVGSHSDDFALPKSHTNINGEIGPRSATLSDHKRHIASRNVLPESAPGSKVSSPTNVRRHPSESDLSLQTFVSQVSQNKVPRVGIFNKKTLLPNSLKWSKDSLKKPLLSSVDKSIKKEAREVFKLIQGYMGDRRTKYDQDEIRVELVKRGFKNVFVRNEIYMQLCKQTTENPRANSLQFGWELMAICLSFFPPTIKFHSHLEDYLRKALIQTPEMSVIGIDVPNLSTICLKRLEKIVAKETNSGLKKPSLDDIKQAKKTIFEPSLFGNTLEDLMEMQKNKYPELKLPWVLQELAEEVLRLGGTETEGTFRLSGDVDEVNRLKIKCDKWMPLRCSDSHVASSLLKQWFRELTEPLIPSSFYHTCLKVKDDPGQALAIIETIPSINKFVLTYLINFLQIFIKPEVVLKTKMDVNNLSMIWAPNCLWLKDEDPASILDNSSKAMSFIKILIVNMKCQHAEKQAISDGSLGR